MNDEIEKIKIPPELDYSDIDVTTERMQKASKALEYREANICDECRRPYDEDNFSPDPECDKALEDLSMREVFALKEHQMRLHSRKISGVNKELLGKPNEKT